MLDFESIETTSSLSSREEIFIQALLKGSFSVRYFILLLLVFVVGCGQAVQSSRKTPGRQEPAKSFPRPSKAPLQDKVSPLSLSPVSSASLVETGSILVKNCNVSSFQSTDVAAEEAGVLKKFHVREGTVVLVADKLVQIGNEDAQARFESAKLDHEAAELEALSNVNVRAAKEAEKVAAAELAESNAVNEASKGAIPPTQIRREELTQKRAKLQIEVAELEHRVAGLTSKVRESQVKVAELSVKRRLITSLIDGVVERRYKDVGEWVQPGEPIIQVIHMERLRVEGFLRADQVAPTDVIGKSVSVEVVFTKTGSRTESDSATNSELFGPFKGKLEFVSNQVQVGGEYRVWTEVANRKTPEGRWVLRPGMVATMKIDLVD